MKETQINKFENLESKLIRINYSKIKAAVSHNQWGWITSAY